MKKTFKMFLGVVFFTASLALSVRAESHLPLGVREVHATSCEVIRVNVALGMTSQIIFEQPPTMTLHADEEHFKIRTNPDAKRSIAIIPSVDQNTLSQLFLRADGSPAVIPSEKSLAQKLDEVFTTNLFVFFKNANQLMFQVHFVQKSNADYILNVKQKFGGQCNL